jgi:hypothetical protein
MSRRLPNCAALATCCLLAVLPTASRAAEFSYDGIRLGMTLAQFRNLNRTTECNEQFDRDYTPASFDECYRDYEPSFGRSRISPQVLYHFDKKRDSSDAKLVRIIIQSNRGDAFAEFDSLLTERYGPPREVIGSKIPSRKIWKRGPKTLTLDGKCVYADAAACVYIGTMPRETAPGLPRQPRNPFGN